MDLGTVTFPYPFATFWATTIKDTVVELDPSVERVALLTFELVISPRAVRLTFEPFCTVTAIAIEVGIGVAEGCRVGEGEWIGVGLGVGADVGIGLSVGIGVGSGVGDGVGGIKVKSVLIVQLPLIVAEVEGEFALLKVADSIGVALQEEKTYPLPALAVIETTWPAVYVWTPEGLVVPLPVVPKVTW
jgi:hypothetical protein